VVAPAGTWITVTVDQADGTAIDVTTDDGAEVVQGGDRVLPSGNERTRHAQVTWPQVRNGAVGYLVGTSNTLAVPEAPPVVQAFPYHVRATLAGKAFDRQPDCGQIPPDHVPTMQPDTSHHVQLGVRILSARADAALVRRAMPRIATIYRQIGIDVRVSYDTMRVPPSMTDQFKLMDAARAHYGGTRPRGVDVVYLATDNFAGGGYASCVGGIQYPERAFAVGGIHYMAGGAVTVPFVDPAIIAAHEIGHLLGAHHHYATCVAGAEPAGATQGGVGPCTLMFPAAVGASGTFSPTETAYIRDYTTRFARSRR
jgi:hypothetical protein